MLKITATVASGRHIGTELKPHLYKDGCYVVAKGGNTLAHATRVSSLDEVVAWIRRGYGVRMSGPCVSPSIYSAGSLSVSGHA